jgi:hypothetical protein
MKIFVQDYFRQKCGETLPQKNIFGTKFDEVFN